MKEQCLELMWDFMRQAGHVALTSFNDTQFTLKPDGSVLTQADSAISRLIHQKLDPFRATGEHLLIEEEDPQRGQYLDQQLLAQTPYIWSVDPIDGTRLFSNHMPLFGISIGVIKDLAPWLGMVFFPALDELFYADGDQAYFVQHPFSAQPQQQRLEPVDLEVSNQALFLMSDTFFKKYHWSYEHCRFLVTACATVNLCWPSVGRACGAMDQSHLWDFAGAWPIVQQAGLALRDFQTGRILDRLDSQCFDSGAHPWRLKQYYIVSSARNYDILKSKIIAR
jgi:myo-inositol-1(or 4)-monophosphatase